MGIPLSHALVVATALLTIGLLGVVLRRSLIFTLLSIEVMLNAAGLALVAAGAHHGQADGQVLFLFVLTVAAAEVSVGLALLLRLHRERGTLDSDSGELAQLGARGTRQAEESEGL